MCEIKNRDDVIKKVSELLKEHEGVRYQEDIYLYLDNGIGRVETFFNPDGNSWLDDDHIDSHAMKEDLRGERLDILIEWNEGDAASLAEALGIELADNPAAAEEFDAQYLRDALRKKVEEGGISLDPVWNDYLYDFNEFFSEMAETIVDGWEKGLERTDDEFNEDYECGFQGGAYYGGRSKAIRRAYMDYGV